MNIYCILSLSDALPDKLQLKTEKCTHPVGNKLKFD